MCWMCIYIMNGLSMVIMSLSYLPPGIWYVPVRYVAMSRFHNTIWPLQNMILSHKLFHLPIDHDRHSYLQEREREGEGVGTMRKGWEGGGMRERWEGYEGVGWKGIWWQRVGGRWQREVRVERCGCVKGCVNRLHWEDVWRLCVDLLMELQVNKRKSRHNRNQINVPSWACCASFNAILSFSLSRNRPLLSHEIN